MENSDYQAGLEILKKKNPAHPILRTLNKGISPINIKYLEYALENANLYRNEAPEVSTEIKDPTLRQLYRKLGALMGDRGKTSNKLHDCTSDAQRSFVVDEIFRIQKKIKSIYDQIEAFELNGKIPEIKSVDKFPIPDTPLLMQKKIINLNSQISHKKRMIKKLTSEYIKSPSDKLSKKKFTAERKLGNLTIHREHVKQALAVATI